MLRHIGLVASLVLLPALAIAGPISREEADRQNIVLLQLKASVAAETNVVAQIALIGKAMSAEPAVALRGRMLDLAVRLPGPALDEFLIGLLKSEEDAGLRSRAATMLGHSGSEECLPALLKTAASDRTTSIQIGDIGSTSSARRAATFAVAELAERFPKLADQAAAGLSALPDVADPKDNESLADARRQALYRISHDEKLLAPFYKRLKSSDAKEREQGVIAFQFLNLHKPPPEIIASLQDASPDVRSWAALVLGAIGGPQSVEALTEAALDAKQDRLVRANAITALGRMRAMPAAEVMEKLLGDPDLSANAAIALYRITGRKVKQFPEGYNAD